MASNRKMTRPHADKKLVFVDVMRNLKLSTTLTRRGRISYKKHSLGDTAFLLETSLQGVCSADIPRQWIRPMIRVCPCENRKPHSIWSKGYSHVVAHIRDGLTICSSAMKWRCTISACRYFVFFRLSYLSNGICTRVVYTDTRILCTYK